MATDNKTYTRIKEDKMVDLEIAIFAVESLFKPGNSTRRLLFKARCEVVNARGLNRENKDWPQNKEILDTEG